jgi:GNAT superfamily N-acetyltransferase
MKIREAKLEDVEAMVGLSEAFRTTLAGYNPVFWPKAEDSAEKQAIWFRILVPLDDVLALVADEDGGLRGFVIGRLQQAPPVYATDGPACLIDDFCVASDGEWPSVGGELLAEIERRARERGAGVSVVICPHLGAAKRAFLAERGFAVTTEWHVHDL